ncbi:MAG: helix-turn-helix transcriptional regulator [Oscillibacter sp.]|nr:helix-turn-helix transcriptional regulator [Oscillibacter sp.]MBQ9616944.1 helix-turn-helix transcriptional regulator [Oscillibacter sp.]
MKRPVTFDEYLAEQMKDPEFKAEWDALEPEFQIIRAIIEGREARQFSEEQLAEATGISPAEIVRLEEGNADPTLTDLKRLAAGLGMTLRLDFQPIA